MRTSSVIALQGANYPATHVDDVTNLIKYEELGWNTLTIDCGHDVMLNRPEGLARVLMAIAGARGMRHGMSLQVDPG
jgi:hypothetical protein